MKANLLCHLFRPSAPFLFLPSVAPEEDASSLGPAAPPANELEEGGHSDYWILYRNNVRHNGERRVLKVDLDSLREGQTVGCMVSREGELHVYIDGVDKSIVWTGLPTHKPFWGVADVHGCTKKIQLVSPANCNLLSIIIYN